MSPVVGGGREAMKEKQGWLAEIGGGMVDVGILVACFGDCEAFVGHCIEMGRCGCISVSRLSSFEGFEVRSCC